MIGDTPNSQGLIGEEATILEFQARKGKCQVTTINY